MENKNIYAYLRSHEQQTLLVLHNFSAQVQPDLALPAKLKLTVARDIAAATPTAAIAALAPFATRIYEVKAVDPGTGR